MYFKIIISILLLFIYTSCSLDCKYLKYTDGITYIKGIKYSGDCISYYPDGTITSKRSYYEGLDNGKWEFFHPNGNLETVGNYYQGVRIGQWSYFFENGSIKQKSYYKDGLKDSIWTNYLLNGDPLWEKEFKKDTLISVTDFQRFR